MYYVIIENGEISSVLGYEPNVPETHTVIEISDAEYDSILMAKTHYFDLTDLTVKSYAQDYLDAATTKETQRIANAEKRYFLENSDWKVMRHIREKALGQTTTLTDQEYLDLEQSRADAAAAIVEIQ
jgi:hypothetical protein